MNNTKQHCGWVALIGPPNAGKSTLMNAVLGQKVAIVSPKPQTTRNQISGILSEPRGQIVFLDTPGVHRQRGQLHKLMQQATWQALASANAAVCILDADLALRQPDRFGKELALLRESLGRTASPLLIAANKVDLVRDKTRLLPLIESLSKSWPDVAIHPVSAASGEGLDDLVAALYRVLPEGPPLFPEDQISTVPMRFMAAEIIREKLFLSMFEELPYAMAVDIESWEEAPEGGQVVINAVIYVGRKQHKAMVIGKQGQTIKEIGTAARLEIAELLEQRVHLELWVKVREQWMEDESFLRSLGLDTGVV